MVTLKLTTPETVQAPTLADTAVITGVKLRLEPVAGLTVYWEKRQGTKVVASGSTELQVGGPLLAQAPVNTLLTVLYTALQGGGVFTAGNVEIKP